MERWRASGRALARVRTPAARAPAGAAAAARGRTSGERVCRYVGGAAWQPRCDSAAAHAARRAAHRNAARAHAARLRAAVRVRRRPARRALNRRPLPLPGPGLFGKKGRFRIRAALPSARLYAGSAARSSASPCGYDCWSERCVALWWGGAACRAPHGSAPARAATAAAPRRRARARRRASQSRATTPRGGAASQPGHRPSAAAGVPGAASSPARARPCCRTARARAPARRAAVRASAARAAAVRMQCTHAQDHARCSRGAAPLGTASSSKSTRDARCIVASMRSSATQLWTSAPPPTQRALPPAGSSALPPGLPSPPAWCVTLEALCAASVWRSSGKACGAPPPCAARAAPRSVAPHPTRRSRAAAVPRPWRPPCGERESSERGAELRRARTGTLFMRRRCPALAQLLA